jgi:hypothetical protein
MRQILRKRAHHGHPSALKISYAERKIPRLCEQRARDRAAIRPQALAAVTSEVQWGQRLAFNEMAVSQ